MSTRTFTDEELSLAISKSRSWRNVLINMGRPGSGSTASIRKRATELGIKTDHLDGWKGGNRYPQVMPQPVEISSQGILDESAVGIAIAYFMSHGATVSVPLSPTTYDLIADWGEGLKKIQVKSGNCQRKGSPYSVKIVKTRYRKTAEGQPWKYVHSPYEPEDLDLFFILLGDGTRYLIPFDAVSGQSVVSLPGAHSMYQV